jgi:hypothetical protein
MNIVIYTSEFDDSYAPACFRNTGMKKSNPVDENAPKKLIEPITAVARSKGGQYRSSIDTFAGYGLSWSCSIRFWLSVSGVPSIRSYSLSISIP